MGQHISALLWVGRIIVLTLVGVIGNSALAEENAIERVEALSQQGQSSLRIQLASPVQGAPQSFATAVPPRIVLDFSDTTNATGQARFWLESGDFRSVDLVQVAGRTRLVLHLKRARPFRTEISGREVRLVLGSAVAQVEPKAEPNTEPKAEHNTPSQTPLNTESSKAAQAAAIAIERNAIVDIDFRRGEAQSGRIVIDLAQPQHAIDVRRQGQAVVVDLMKTRLPEVLRRRLDVRDFGTPVQTISALADGDRVRLTIEPQGQWDHIAWQTDRRLVVEVRPLRPEADKLGHGGGFRGDKLSLNFQNIEVRALLQVIADFTGLNVVASDSVAGNLTLRLKEVPWDQALDIVMQARGLDLRRHGNVLWIAPKDELLTKERLELEQRAQIAELEPLVTETFQLNYQKAEAFRQAFSLDGQGNRGSVLSRRGSAAAEARTNKLFVTDTPAKLDEVRRLIQTTDVPTRQVMIEARIVEADDKFSRNLGAKLGYADMNLLRATSAGGVNLSGGVRASVSGNYQGMGEQTAVAEKSARAFNNTQFINLPAASINGRDPGSLGVSLYSASANRFLYLELSALEADGKGKIIASPRVVTADQQPAIIEQGEEIPYQQATSSGATSITFKKANLKLEVTPQITPDGTIILSVDVAKDSRGTAVGASFAIDTKHVKTNVQVENGGTVALGGIYTQEERDDQAKVPLLGDLPVVGHLFKSTSRIRNRTELLIFITPRIVETLAQLR
jgi:type IV pilus assembly protein PilQ